MLTTTLWAAQTVLALFFLFAGLPKIAGRGIDRWTGFDDVPRPLTVLIGIAEVAASVALVLPMLLGSLSGRRRSPRSASLWSRSWRAASTCGPASGCPPLETALWAMLAGAVAVGRWDLMATGPSLAADLLVPVIGVLVVALVVNIVAIFRTPAPAATHDVTVAALAEEARS